MTGKGTNSGLRQQTTFHRFHGFKCELQRRQYFEELLRFFDELERHMVNEGIVPGGEGERLLERVRG